MEPKLRKPNNRNQAMETKLRTHSCGSEVQEKRQGNKVKEAKPRKQS
jgi:hypothetical protein